MDQTLDQMWREAQLRFSELTGTVLTSQAGLGELQRLIDARLHQMEEASSGEARKRKDVGLNILSCIKMLGGIAAKGASLVVAPADLCFSALSLLLDIPQKIRDFHEMIEEVFLEVLSTLSQFKIYARIDMLDQIDGDLKMAIHRVLISFVDICAACINISNSGRWERFKGHAKRVLCEDKELEDELKKLRSLVRGQQYVQNAVSLEVVLGNKAQLTGILAKLSQTEVKVAAVETGVGILVEAEGSRKQDASRRQQLVHIRSCFGFAEEATEGSRGVHEDRVRRLIPGTGEWLKSSDSYLAWADRHRACAGAVLYLSGPPSVGKSFAVSSMIEHLASEETRPGDPDRSVIAYHFFSMPTGKHDDESRPVAVALKWICLRLAEQDAAYAKAVYDILSQPDTEKLVRSTSSLALWKILRLGSPMRGATHYILLDGLDNLPKSSLDQLRDVFRELPGAASGNDPCTIRVLACGDLEAFDPEMMQAKGSPVINIREHLAEDMRKYIRHELQALFPDQRLEKQKQDIEDRLLAQSSYTFRSIQNALDNVRKLIESSGAVEELDQILAKSSRDPKEITKEEIEKLEAQLNARQISLLNELLAWVLCGRESFSVEQLEAALFLRFKETILEGLDSFIEKRLKKIFTTNPAGRILFADGIKEVVVKEREVPRTVADHPMISLDIKISNVDLQTAQRFLWDLTRYSTLESFTFGANNLVGSQQSPKGHIRANEIDAHLSIVKNTMTFLRAPTDPKAKSIGSYLLQCLPQHLEALRDATGLDSIGADDRKAIAKCVFDLFDDVEIVKTHWDACSKVTWFKDQAQLAIFLGWLQDNAANSNFSRNDRIWLNEVGQSSNPGRALLSPVMRTVARLWLRSPTGPPKIAFEWIAGFLRLGASRSDGSPPTTPSAAESSAANAKTDPVVDKEVLDESQIIISASDSNREAVLKATKWCRLVLGLKEEDINSLWHQRLGFTYLNMGINDKASEEFLAAQALPNPSWAAFDGLATSLWYRGRLSEASSVLQEALKRPQLYERLSEAEKISAYSRVAESHAMLWRPEQAISSCKMALELQPEDPHCRCLLFKFYSKFKRYQDARELLAAASKHVHQCTATGRDRSQLAALLNSLAVPENDEGRPTAVVYILTVAFSAGFYETLLNDVETATDTARIENRYCERAALLLYHGMARFYRYRSDPGTGDADIARALSLWKESCMVAQKYFSRNKCAMTNICHQVCFFQSCYHFDELLAKSNAASLVEKSQDPETTQLVRLQREAQDHLTELESILKTFHRQLNCGCSDLPPAQTYLASYHAAQGNFTKAREILTTDMNKVLGMLSDGDGSNDNYGLSLLHIILLHSGDAENAAAAISLIFPGSVPTRYIKEILSEIHLGSRQDVVTDSERESVTQIIALSKEKLQLAPDDDAVQHIKYLTRQIDALTQTAPNNKWYPAIRATLTNVAEAISEGGYYTCDNCQVLWDFEHEFYACRYCYSMHFCRACLGALKGQSKQRMAMFCGPDHNWLELPRWDAKRWTEAWRKTVKVPRTREGGGGKEYELLDVGVWLSRVVGGWGLKDEKWDFGGSSGVPGDTKGGEVVVEVSEIVVEEESEVALEKSKAALEVSEVTE
ncbi:hypothetical protein OQA88_2565 [Cercophora sp. LCS_1]